jgi:CDGSH-type Zn-finger protein
MSGNKPFCDGSHRAGFHDAGRLAPQERATDAEPGPITVIVGERGPYRIKGAVTISGAGGERQVYPQATLCRCGTSRNKPFCDGSHQHVNQEIFE